VPAVISASEVGSWHPSSCKLANLWPTGRVVELTSMKRRDVWAYGLAGVEVAALTLWVRLLTTDSDMPWPVSDLFYFLWVPVVIVLLASLGILMWGRVWLSGQAHHRVPRSLRLLKWASAFVLVPMFGYGLLVLYVVTAPEI
jgi:hypothetical protein